MSPLDSVHAFLMWLSADRITRSHWLMIYNAVPVFLTSLASLLAMGAKPVDVTWMAVTLHSVQTVASVPASTPSTVPSVIAVWPATLNLHPQDVCK